jgi:hypothetical protein
VLTIVIDLDRPQEGLVNMSQQALLDTQARIGKARAVSLVTRGGDSDSAAMTGRSGLRRPVDRS